MKDKAFKTVKAIYKPLQTDDLRKGIENNIGKTYEFYYAWINELDEFYPSQWALLTKHDDFLGLWIPECDLEIIKE